MGGQNAELSLQSCAQGGGHVSPGFLATQVKREMRSLNSHCAQDGTDEPLALESGCEVLFLSKESASALDVQFAFSVSSPLWPSLPLSVQGFRDS